MLIPKKDRKEIYKYLFKEGVLWAPKDYSLPSHPEIEGVKNLFVIKAMQSFESKELVTCRYAWRNYYWFITDTGIEYLREYLNVPAEVVPATLMKSTRPLERGIGGGDRGGGRGRGGDGYRGGEGRGYGGDREGGDRGFGGGRGGGNNWRTGGDRDEYRGGEGRGFGGRGGGDGEDRGGEGRGYGGRGGGRGGGDKGGAPENYTPQFS